MLAHGPAIDELASLLVSGRPELRVEVDPTLSPRPVAAPATASDARRR